MCGSPHVRANVPWQMHKDQTFITHKPEKPPTPRTQAIDQDWAWRLLEQVSLSEEQILKLTSSMFGKLE